MINLGSSDTTPRQPRSQVTLPGDCTTAELMTVRETAEYLGIDKYKIYYMIEKGELPSVQIGGRWRIKRSLLQRLFGDRPAQPRIKILGEADFQMQVREVLESEFKSTIQIVDEEPTVIIGSPDILAGLSGEISERVIVIFGEGNVYPDDAHLPITLVSLDTLRGEPEKLRLYLGLHVVDKEVALSS